MAGQHNHVSGMYYVSKAEQLVSYATGQLLPQWRATVPANAEMYNGAWTWTPNSRWVNDVRGGYAFVHNQTISSDVAMVPANPWPSGYGFNTGVTNPLYGGLPELTFPASPAIWGRASGPGCVGRRAASIS